ncbi:YceD family protein [Hydrogenimonas sp.]
MQIPFRKIHEAPKPFCLKEDEVECSGTFRRSGKHRVTLEGELKGEIEFACDRCGALFRAPVEESFTLELVDRPVKVEESLDMIECLDGIVDFDGICKSEIGSMQSEYHLCPECEDEEDFEKEF